MYSIFLHLPNGRPCHLCLTVMRYYDTSRKIHKAPYRVGLLHAVVFTFYWSHRWERIREKTTALEQMGKIFST